MSQRVISRGVVEALNEAPLSGFHFRAMLTSGMGFFTDSYDLFIIGTAVALIKVEYNPSALILGLISSTSLISAFVGAFIFGRVADIFGRKSVYGLEAGIMAIGAVLSALSPSLIWLIAFRFLLGVGIGGDYPVSAVLMSEYSNRQNRGRLVGMVFSMQAAGLIVGPLVALVILALGVPTDLAWRLMLGLGAIPALGVIYLRRTMPESPRYLARVRGKEEEARRAVESYSHSTVTVDDHGSDARAKLSLGAFLSNPRFLLTLLGTAGCWFFFDYAYYGNTISTPLIIKSVAPGASLIHTTALSFVIFALAAAPGYVMAFMTMDRIGHKRVQIIGFITMGAMFLLIGIIPGITKEIAPFLVLYGLSYFFTEFGPNTTTFVLASELFPVSMRTTGMGISAGMAKVGAFIGALTVPLVLAGPGLPAVMVLAFASAVVGTLLTFVLTEPAGKSIEDASHEDQVLVPSGAAAVGAGV